MPNYITILTLPSGGGATSGGGTSGLGSGSTPLPGSASPLEKVPFGFLSPNLAFHGEGGETGLINHFPIYVGLDESVKSTSRRHNKRK